MASPEQRDKIREKLGQIADLCPKIVNQMNRSSDGWGETRTGEMLNELYDLVLELERKGRYYAGGPRLAKIF